MKFTERFQETPTSNLQPFQQDGFIASSTKQLRWKEGVGGKAAGYFTMNTDGTKAVVGFAEGQVCQLGEVTITPQSRFAAIYVSAPEKDGKIANSRRLLITALARARNTGMKFSVGGDDLLDKGKGPVLMEPVKVTIALAGRRVTGVRLLDHDGRRTEKTVPVTNGQFTLDGARDQTSYYEVTVE